MSSAYELIDKAYHSLEGIMFDKAEYLENALTEKILLRKEEEE